MVEKIEIVKKVKIEKNNIDIVRKNIQIVEKHWCKKIWIEKINRDSVKNG